MSPPWNGISPLPGGNLSYNPHFGASVNPIVWAARVSALQESQLNALKAKDAIAARALGAELHELTEQDNEGGRAAFCFIESKNYQTDLYSNSTRYMPGAYVLQDVWRRVIIQFPLG